MPLSLARAPALSDWGRQRIDQKNCWTVGVLKIMKEMYDVEYTDGVSIKSLGGPIARARREARKTSSAAIHPTSAAAAVSSASL